MAINVNENDFLSSKNKSCVLHVCIELKCQEMQLKVIFLTQND